MLLQVLEDGHITDAHGKKVDFKNTIIIMTSNAGANRIISPKTLGFGQAKTSEEEYQKMKEGVMEEVKHIFKPEFINRVDEMIVFHALNKENIKDITKIMLKQFAKRVKDQMDMELCIADDVVDFISVKALIKITVQDQSAVLCRPNLRTFWQRLCLWEIFLSEIRWIFRFLVKERRRKL